MDVLIIDDEPYIQRALEFVLRKEGFEVDVASDGAEGLKKARELHPKMIYLDLMMPGIDGIEVCKKIKDDEKLKDIYVIILTAKGQDVDKDRGIAAGADEFMTKPFSPKEVIEKTKINLRKA